MCSFSQRLALTKEPLVECRETPTFVSQWAAISSTYRSRSSGTLLSLLLKDVTASVRLAFLQSDGEIKVAAEMTAWWMFKVKIHSWLQQCVVPNLVNSTASHKGFTPKFYLILEVLHPPSFSQQLIPRLLFRLSFNKAMQSCSFWLDSLFQAEELRPQLYLSAAGWGYTDTRK